MEAKYPVTQIDRNRVGGGFPLKLGSAFLLFCSFFILVSSCKSGQIKKAELAHRSQRYIEAAQLYHQLYRKAKRQDKEKKAYFAFKSAENYRMAQNPLRAKNAYIAARNYHYPDSILYLRIAQMEQRIGNTKEAIRLYEEFLASYPQDFFARQGLQSCMEQETLQKNPYRYIVAPAKRLSSARSDFGGAFSPDGKAFYFTSSRNRNPEIEKSEITGEKPNDLYFIQQDAKGKWSKVDSVAGGINTPDDEGMPCISSDGTKLYYTFAESNDLYDRTAKIYTASKSGEGGWSKGQQVNIWGDTDSLKMAAHPTLSQSKDKLYFVSEGGFGKKDIYMIEVDKIGAGVPTNVGAAINTSGNEISPTMVGDSTLYFASDGHKGLGGYDLYKAQLNSKGEWSVTHLGSPINSSHDDFAICFNPEPKKENVAEGYFASSRKDMRGYPHLYSFEQKAIRILLKGYVYDRDGEAIQGATIRLVGENTPELENIASSKEDGSYTLELSSATAYVLLAGAEGFLNQYASFETDKEKESATYELDFQLTSRRKAEVFSDIFYAFDSAELLPESKKELLAITKILKENPDVKVELSAHADRKGGEEYNLKLSERRAKSVVDFLVEQGIPAERLVPKGYGEKKPRIVTELLNTYFPYLPIGAEISEELINTLNEEQQEICDRLNRRTEFKVLEE